MHVALRSRSNCGQLAITECNGRGGYGRSRLLLFSLETDGITVIAYDPEIDLKTVGTRTITPSGVLAGFGSNPGGGGRVYLTKPAFPFIQENISGEIRDKWPWWNLQPRPIRGRGFRT